MLNFYSLTQIRYAEEITTEDFYRDMYENKEQFDLSDMKLKQFKHLENKKVVGKFKDETQGIPICEFIGLRSKMYSINQTMPVKRKQLRVLYGM